MKIIQVNSLPVLEVIQDLAKAFNTDFIMDTCIYKLKIPDQIGTGWIQGYHLDNGLGLLEYNCTFFQDIEIQFVVSSVHPLKFLYVTKGNLEHRFENEDTIHSLEEYQSSIVASCDNYGHILNFSANTSVAKFSVEINREKFNISNAYKTEDVATDLFELFEDYKAKNTFYYRGDYSLSIADIFSNLKLYDDQFEGDKLVYKFYLESMAYQTLVMHLTQYLDDQNDNNSQHIVRKKEFDQIKSAVEYIKSNLEFYSGLDELTTHTGLNTIKLQKGFKYLFDNTVNQYVQEQRLEKARELLIESDKSISEIVSAIGLKSASYFSRIFKDKYGVQPSLFSKNK